jgi:hypothetical protein
MSNKGDLTGQINFAICMTKTTKKKIIKMILESVLTDMARGMCKDI